MAPRGQERELPTWEYLWVDGTVNIGTFGDHRKPLNDWFVQVQRLGARDGGFVTDMMLYRFGKSDDKWPGLIFRRPR